MGLAAALCIGIGSLPGLFYALLPFASEYQPYRPDHVTAQTQLLFWSALAFAWLMRTGIYPPELRSTNLDFDWLYRGLGRSSWGKLCRWAATLRDVLTGAALAAAARIEDTLRSQFDSAGIPARMTRTSSMVFWATLLLAAYLLLSYL